eukprot:5281362-Prymnesium_polylepis.1
MTNLHDTPHPRALLRGKKRSRRPNERERLRAKRVSARLAHACASDATDVKPCSGRPEARKPSVTS